MPIRQSLVCSMFQPVDMQPDAFFDAVREIGYPAVEMHFRSDEVDDLIERAIKAGLAVASICGHRSLKQGLNDTTQHDRIETELHENIDFAAAHGIPSLICFPGNRNDGQSDEQAMDATVQGLMCVAPYAQDKGVTLNLELLNSKIDHPGYQADHTAWGVAVCEQVNSPRVKLLYDIYHMQIMEGDVIRTLKDHIQWIGHVHTAGNPGRQDLDDMQELNYRGICAALSDADYAGYVGHEFNPKADRLAAAQAAFDLCNR